MKSLIEFCKTNVTSESIVNTTNIDTAASIFEEDDWAKEITSKSPKLSTSWLLKNKQIEKNFDTKNYTHLNNFTEISAVKQEGTVWKENIATWEINLYK